MQLPDKILQINTNDPPETDYTSALSQFERIREHDVLLVFGDAVFNYHTLGYILFAFSLHKPVLLTTLPKFTPDISPYYRDLVELRINKMVLGNLFLLDDLDKTTLLENILSEKQTNYVLNKQERIMISAYLRAYFRALI